MLFDAPSDYIVSSGHLPYIKIWMSTRRSMEVESLSLVVDGGHRTGVNGFQITVLGHLLKKI